jgi:hypothetical protein
MVDREIVGQALFTWSPNPLGTGGKGYGFVDISPAWKEQLAWLDAATKSLTSFTRGLPATEEQRAGYRPLGRYVHTGTALVYLKYYLGLDGYNRPGNYAAHFFMAPMQRISITDSLRIPDELWFNGSGVYGPSWRKLEDVGFDGFHASMRPTIEPGAVNPKRILDAIERLVNEGSADLSKWNTAEIATLTGTLPCWADYAASLEPTWTEAGPSLIIDIPQDAGSDSAFLDRRVTPAAGELAELRKKLDSATCLSEARSILSPRPRGSGHAATISKKRLEDCIIKWVHEGTKSLTPDESTLLEKDPSSTFVNLDKLNRRIAPTKKLDPFTLSLLDRCDAGIDRRLLGSVLPVEDELTGLYAGASTNSAVLETAIILNADSARSIDIILRRTIPNATIKALIDTSRTDELFMKGLTQSLRISSLGEGSFARQLFSADTADWDHLYSEILPAATRGRSDSLLSLACVNPEKFVAWIGAPEPYASALTDMLRHETQQAVWERISALLGRWRKR